MISDFGNEEIEGKVIHKKFKATTQGFEWDSFPMKLYMLGEKLSWSSLQIDFNKDAIDWKNNMKEADKFTVLGTSSFFLAGEECVARDIIPMISAMEELGFIEEAMYLTQFAKEETNHAIGFRRWFEVIGETEKLDYYTKQNEGYRKLFYEIIPTDMKRLYKDPSPENIVKAAISYNLVAEGIGAETGYYSYIKGYQINPVLPGLISMIRLIARDESRHVSFGAYVISLMISNFGKELYEVYTNYFTQLAPLISQLIEQQRKFLLSPNWREEDKGPLFKYFTSDEGVNDLLSYAQKMFLMRNNLIERSVKMKSEEVRKMGLKELGLEGE
jgi:ribonucleoside-diphosphate reductase beta chain